MTLLLTEDYKLIAVSLGFVLAVLGLGWLLLRALGLRGPDLLTGREAELVAKVAGCVALVVILFMADNALRLPQEMFIYGRF